MAAEVAVALPQLVLQHLPGPLVDLAAVGLGASQRLGQVQVAHAGDAAQFGGTPIERRQGQGGRFDAFVVRLVAACFSE